MIGSNSTSLVASAYLQGIDMDIDLLWEAVMKNAFHAHPEYISVGRSGIGAYLKYGYVPNDIGLKESAARTLEYCYADFCLYKLAEALGRKKEQEEFARRALNYRNLFHPGFGMMAGRNSAGEFRPDFNPLPGAATLPRGVRCTTRGAFSTTRRGSHGSWAAGRHSFRCLIRSSRPLLFSTVRPTEPSSTRCVKCRWPISGSMPTVTSRFST